jgi:hypothetical protein
MKKLQLQIGFITVLLVSGCMPKVIPLKGSYPDTPIIQYSDNNVDKVWDHTIDFFAQKGLSIKIIDKSSGLIISDETALTWTFEDKKGNLIKTNRWVAVPRTVYSGSDNPITPTSVIGEWNVRIKSDGSRTSINVNLVNIQAKFSTGESGYKVAPSYTRVDGKSTGVFEKMIFEAVK